MWKGVVGVALGTLALSVSTATVRAQQPVQSNAMQMLEHNRDKMVADERQKKMLQDADHLLSMAQQLKEAVDKTKKDELSMQVIREADQIEKLAKSVKDRMRQ